MLSECLKQKKRERSFQKDIPVQSTVEPLRIEHYLSGISKQHYKDEKVDRVKGGIFDDWLKNFKEQQKCKLKKRLKEGGKNQILKKNIRSWNMEGTLKIYPIFTSQLHGFNNEKLNKIKLLKFPRKILKAKQTLIQERYHTEETPIEDEIEGYYLKSCCTMKGGNTELQNLQNEVKTERKRLSLFKFRVREATQSHLKSEANDKTFKGKRIRTCSGNLWGT